MHFWPILDNLCNCWRKFKFRLLNLKHLFSFFFMQSGCNTKLFCQAVKNTWYYTIGDQIFAIVSVLSLVGGYNFVIWTKFCVQNSLKKTVNWPDGGNNALQSVCLCLEYLRHMGGVFTSGGINILPAGNRDLVAKNGCETREYATL